MRLFQITFFGALAAALLCSTLSAQPAAEVKCGMMVTANLTLTSDLVCPALAPDGAALTVVRSGVKVDLNGHTLRGPGGAGFGVLVPGADNVTILNGEIRGFMMGVFVTTAGPDRSYSPRLTQLRLMGNGMIGACLDGVRFGEVSDSEASENAMFGIVVFNGSDYTVVSGNLTYANGRSGIIVGCDPWTQDPKGGSLSSCDGLHSTENTIERNTVIANGWKTGSATAGNSGISIVVGDRNVVRDNLVIDNNTVSDGGQLNVTRGIGVYGGADNVIANNRAVNNAVGIQVTWSPGVPAAYAANTVVSGNTAMHNASSGIIFAGEALTGSIIRDNTAIANGHAEKTGFDLQCRSGIRVQGESASVMGNRAYDNVAYGFHVETKDINVQFGNRAMGNGEAAQCLGLTCQ